MRKKQIMAAALAAALLMAGCGGSGDIKTDASAAAGGDTAATAAAGTDNGVITITMAKQQDENAGRYDGSDDINNNPMINLGIEKLGIKIETTLLGGDSENYDTKLRLALTGAEQLPDVLPVYTTQMIADLIESGQVKAIDEDIEKYMPARLKEIYDKYPQTFYPVMKDGKTYGLANCPVLEDTQVMIIRQDWLDNLGLKAPTNMAEFENVIRAFTEDDPDGNGQKDTYGFTYQGKDIYNSGWVADPVMLFSANTGKFVPGKWQQNDSGELMYGSIHEGNKKTLEKMAEWHKNGWLFPEAAATGAWDAMSKFTEGRAGIFMGRPWAAGSVKDVVTVDPNAVIACYPTIRQDNGDPTYQTAQTNDGWIMFSKDFDNMEAFFKYYDWLYDVAFATGDFQYGYLQDYDYDIVDDKVVFAYDQFDPPKTDPFQPSKAILTKNRPYTDRMKAYNDIESGITPETGDQLKAAEFVQNEPAQYQGYVIAYNHQNELVPNLFNAEPTPTMKKNWEQLQTLEKQVYTNIIYGNEPIEAFDKFVEEWKSMGGEQITKEVNEWYQSLN